MQLPKQSRHSTLARATASATLALLLSSASSFTSAHNHSDHSLQPALATSTVSDDLAFMTLPQITARLSSGELTSVQLTQFSVDRIAKLDRQGPSLRSVIAINPDAKAQAAASDARRAEGALLSPLDGIPVLVKDNIETADPLATTAGSTALANNTTGRDNPAIAALRAAGAVILGKTNLSQWANFRSQDSVSGWSAIGGQVKNAHVLDRSPCGSSSGSAVAVAAGLAPLAIGTETNGSIICPSQVNGIVGFKPTVGLVSGEYIVPIAPSQDTAGPMARSVEGAALLLDGLTGGDHDFVSALDGASLDGKRIGVLRFAEGSSAHISGLFNKALARLEALGAELIDIEDFEAVDAEAGRLSLPVLEWEFKASLNAYLEDSPADISVRSLEQLIAWNTAHAHTELALFDQSLFDSSELRTGLDDPAYQEAVQRIQNNAGSEGIDRLLRDYNVELLVSPSGPVAPAIDSVNGDIWPAWAGAGYLAAIAGYPHITVPMGTAQAIPVGLSFMASKGQDAAVLAAGHAWQQDFGAVPVPGFLPSADQVPAVKAAVEGLVGQ